MRTSSSITIVMATVLLAATAAFGVQCMIDSSEGVFDGEWVLERCFYPEGQIHSDGDDDSAIAEIVKIGTEEGVATGWYGEQSFQGAVSSGMMYVGGSCGMEAMAFLDSKDRMHMGITCMREREPFSAFCIYLKQGGEKGVLDGQPDIVGSWGFSQVQGSVAGCPVAQVEIDSLSGPIFTGTIHSGSESLRMNGFLTMKDVRTMSMGMAIDSAGARWGVLATSGSLHLLGIGCNGAFSVSLAREIDGIRQTSDSAFHGGEWRSDVGSVLSISELEDDLVIIDSGGDQSSGYLVYDRPLSFMSIIGGGKSIIILAGDTAIVVGIGPESTSTVFTRAAP